MHSLIAYIFLAEVRSLLKSFSLRLQTFRTPCSSNASSSYGARRDMVGGESRDAVATPAGFVLTRDRLITAYLIKPQAMRAPLPPNGSGWSE
jgi:hypothetical protein